MGSGWWLGGLTDMACARGGSNSVVVSSRRLERAWARFELAEVLGLVSWYRTPARASTIAWRESGRDAIPARARVPRGRRS